MCRFASLETIRTILKCPDVDFPTFINNTCGPYESTAAIDCVYSKKSLAEKMEILKLLKAHGADLTKTNIEETPRDIFSFLEATIKKELGLPYQENLISN